MRYFLPLYCLVLATSPSFSQGTLEFLSISDIHLNKGKQTSMYIDPIKYNPQNDMDIASYKKILGAVKTHTSQDRHKPKFVIYLGDIVGHAAAMQDRVSFVKENAGAAFRELLSAFPETPIIAVVGNNDSPQRNYGNFQNNGISPFTIAMDNGFKNGFLSTGVMCTENTNNHTVLPCIAHQSPEFGYFSVNITPSLLVIGLNSVMFSPKHASNKTAITSQFKFLSRTLRTAQKEGHSILIAMHIPVGRNVFDGSHFWLPQHEDNFLELVSQYQDVVKGILVGHTHMEEFQVIRAGRKNIGQYFTAGLSTSHGNSPSVKVFEMARNNTAWAIKDYTTYQIHNGENENITFSPYYTFSDVYCSHIDRKHDINRCLSHVQFQDTRAYFTVGNPNNPSYTITDPSGFYVETASPKEMDLTRNLKDLFFQLYAWISSAE